MTDYDDELDIELRDADDVGCRIVVLAALSIWPGFDTPSERRGWQQWLESQGVVIVATPFEHELLAIDSSDHLTSEMTDACERALDAIGPLAWAAALTDRISIVESEFGTDELAESLPMPTERIELFLDQLVMRDEDTIALERERAELWNWRLTSEAICRNVGDRQRSEIVEAIHEVVLESAMSFAIEEVDLEDFIFDGIPVKRIDDERLEALIVLSEERLRAFNWLCGLTEWDAIHIPD